MDKKSQSKETHDTIFAVKITESMEIRNILRSGLFEAQGAHPEKIPLYVSWPSWLEDGIVCIFARDLKNLLRKAVRDAAVSFAEIIGDPSEILPDNYMDDFMTLPELPHEKISDNGVDGEFHELRAEEIQAGRMIHPEPSTEKNDSGFKGNSRDRINNNSTNGKKSDTSQEHPQEPDEGKPHSSQDLADALFKKLKSGGA
ncbi:MAG: hypothetical protein JXB48_00175 [Candidatus Latescibacteria bacterium]|nr:hypothetical protein [Candidatus Latescibacterota bacterium]